MEFGIFHEFLSTHAASQAAAFAQSFAQVEAAEEWGLDVLWLAEIHMNLRRSLLSAPLTVASAIAARTRRIRIGTAVQILPLGHPLRLAEETATIDQISCGRLIFGVVGRSRSVSWTARWANARSAAKRWMIAVASGWANTRSNVFTSVWPLVWVPPWR